VKSRRGTLAYGLVVAAILWPLLLAAAVRQQLAGPSTWSAAVYLAASRICHQRDERSFHSHGVKWPVCGRCAGLYAAAPIGAIAAMARRRRPDQAGGRLVMLTVAALPTAVTLAAEWLGVVPVSSLARALAAIPLGLAAAYVVVGVAGAGWESHPPGRSSESIR
jgi:uncharacterized membrane protein